MVRKLLLLGGSDGLEKRGGPAVWRWLERGMVEAMEKMQFGGKGRVMVEFTWFGS